MRKSDHHTFPSKTPIVPLFFLLAILCGITLPTTNAHAGVNPHLSNVCDRDYWNALHHKAWEQAQREIEANAFYIWKPDSILELTCFDSFGDHAALHLGKLFSDIDRDDCGDCLGDALTDAVGAPLYGFTVSNYDYKLGADRLEPNVVVDSDMHDGSYKMDCDWMFKLYGFSMCQNHMNLLYFMDFQDLLSHGADLRDYPEPLKCKAEWPDVPPYWNESNQKSTSMTAIAWYGPEFFDPIVNYYEVTEPVGSPFFIDCRKGEIKTGVEVISPDGNYPEIFCANPGCHPEKTGANSAICVQ